MKLTESKLQELIAEEIELMIESGEIDEGVLDRLKARAAGAGEKLKGAAKSAVQRGVGAVQGAIGDTEDAARTKQKAQLTKYASGQAATNKQALSMMKSYSKKTDKLRLATGKVMRELVKDLKKLGLDNTEVNKLEQRLALIVKMLHGLTNNLQNGKAKL